MKKVIFLLIALVFIFVSLSAAWYFSKFRPVDKAGNRKFSSIENSRVEINKLRGYSRLLKSYAERNLYNTSTAFLIDMKLESGGNRFFVYDLQKDSILSSGLVTHGRCNESWLTGRKYGNKPGCGCTSLGKYRIGNSYYGTFGLAYKLHGLDSTNSNAYRRFVVLHSHECVPERETTPYPICQSDGCPTVSLSFLKSLQKIIDDSKRPMLMWIFE